MDIQIDAEQFDELQRMLEQPPRELPRLRDILTESSPFDPESTS